MIILKAGGKNPRKYLKPVCTELLKKTKGCLPGQCGESENLQHVFKNRHITFKVYINIYHKPPTFDALLETYRIRRIRFVLCTTRSWSTPEILEA